MLLNLHKKTWTDGLAVEKFDAHTKKNGETVKTLLQLTKEYSKWLTEEETKVRLGLVGVGVQSWHTITTDIFFINHSVLASQKPESVRVFDSWLPCFNETFGIIVLIFVFPLP
jgi:hypothetical protein